MNKIIITLLALSSLGLCADTFRVIRDGDLIKTTAPVVGSMVVTTASATLTTGNVNIAVVDSAGTTYYIKANTGQ